MYIYLIRHGRQSSPLCNVNVELAEAGRTQAELLGKRMAHYGIDALYSSHLVRAIQTAEILNRYLKVKHEIRTDLQEISFGDLEGLSHDEIEGSYSEFLKERELMISDIPYPGGENGTMAYERGRRVMDEIVTHDYKNVAVVTHGWLIRSLLAGLLRMNMSDKLLLVKQLENCSITKLYYDREKKRYYIEGVNDYAHLEMDETLLRKYFR